MTHRPAPLAARIYAWRYQCSADPRCPRDAARLAEIERVIQAIEDAGLAVVEAEDGR